jgi:hypothetical protein
LNHWDKGEEADGEDRDFGEKILGDAPTFFAQALKGKVQP